MHRNRRERERKRSQRNRGNLIIGQGKKKIMNPLLVLTHMLLRLQQDGQLYHPLTNQRLESNNKSVGREVVVEVGAHIWGGIGEEPGTNRRALRVRAKGGNMRGGVSKPANLLERWLGERGGVSCQGPG